MKQTPLHQIVDELKQAADLATDVLKSEALLSQESLPPLLVKEIKKYASHPDWEMVTHTTITGVWYEAPYGLSVDCVFTITIAPLVAMAITQPQAHATWEQMIQAIKPNIDPELKEIMTGAATPVSGGYLTDYELREWVIGEQPQPLNYQPKQDRLMVLRLVGQELVFDFHHLLQPGNAHAGYTPFHPNEYLFLATVHVPAATFEHTSPVHRTFTWKENSEHTDMEITTAIHWRPLH